MKVGRRIKEALLRKEALKSREGRSRFWLGLGVLLIAWLVQLTLQSLHFFDHYDRSDADYYAQMMPTASYSSRIIIVTVDDEDYHAIFKSQSPLPYKSVVNLIQTIESYKPRVIGVDFITADWPEPAPKELLSTKSPIVWARDGQELEEDESPRITWNRVAGYSEPPPGLCFAAPSFQPGIDGTVRDYSGSIMAREPSSALSSYMSFPTMARVLASIYPDRALNCQNSVSSGERLIRFAGENHRFMVLRASDVFSDASHGRSLNQYLRDRIVLIGGTYAQGRDRYPSSGGYLSGVELLAHATESEISGPLHALPPLWSLLLGAIVSVIAYLVVFRLRYPFDLVVSAILFLLFSFPTGLIAYRFGNTLIPIASSILALPIGIVCEHMFECPLRDFYRNRQNESQATR